jgi:hypothetical protein
VIPAKRSRSSPRGRRPKTTRDVLRATPSLPYSGLTVAELRVVQELENLQSLLDVLDGPQEPAEHGAPETVLIAQANRLRTEMRSLVDEIATESLDAGQRADLAAYRESLVAWLARLAVVARIGTELTSPDVRARIDQWATVRLSALAAGPLSKNRWTKRRSRHERSPDGTTTRPPPNQMLARAERSLTEFHARTLLERATTDLPGLDWDITLRRQVDDLIRELSAQDVTPSFVSGLLAALQHRPDKWPPVPTSAAVRKRMQRFRKRRKRGQRPKPQA